MAEGLARGQVWMYSFQQPDKRRPVVVLTRQEVIGLLRTVMVVPVTSTIHGAPSEVIIGIDEGLKRDSAANLDHVQTVEKSRLKRYVGRLSPAKMADVCAALAIATGREE